MNNRTLATIRKTSAARDAASDSPTARAQFSWDTAHAWLAGVPGGGVNIAHEAVERHLPEHANPQTSVRHLTTSGTVVPRLWTVPAVR